MKKKSYIKIGIIVIGIFTLFMVLFVMVNSYKMNRMIESEVDAIISDAKNMKAGIFSYKDTENLPEPVQRYFRYVLKDGQEYIRLVRMKAAGEFRRPLKKQWAKMTVTQQYFTTNPPAFLFDAVIKPNAMLWFDIRDKYHQGEGGMHVNMFSGFNVLNTSGVSELNITSFLRYIGEAVLFPTALLPSEHIRWEPIDENSAKAIVSDKGNRGVYRFYFSDVGEIIRYESNDRYDRIDDKLQKVGSVAYRSHYKEINGIKVPTRFSIVRILPDGTHEEFWKGEITEIKYDDFTR